MRIGVTGASGFIGRHLVTALETLPGYQVVPFQWGKKTPSGPEAFKNFVKGKDLIYHLGGVNRGSDEDILRGNILVTSYLLEALKTFGSSTARMVFASSSQVYKLSGSTKILKERSSTEPETIYGISKKSAEDLIRLSGLHHTLLRLTNVYGPGARPNYNSVIATFCDRTVRDIPLTVNGDGSQGRDFIYIDDVVRAFVLAGPSAKRHGTFNVGSGKISSLKQVIQSIRRAGFDVEVKYFKEADPGGPSYCCDSSRFERQFGWKTCTTLSAGIRNTLNGLKKN